MKTVPLLGNKIPPILWEDGGIYALLKYQEVVIPRVFPRSKQNCRGTAGSEKKTQRDRGNFRNFRVTASFPAVSKKGAAEPLPIKLVSFYREEKKSPSPQGRVKNEKKIGIHFKKSNGKILSQRKNRAPRPPPHGGPKIRNKLVLI